MPSGDTVMERVLIAEDDHASRAAMETAVKELGFEALSVADGRAAWEVLAGDDAPELALIGWDLPELNGLEVLRRVRSELGERFCYLIMVAGRNSREGIVHSISQGADDCVLKPFDCRELAVRIRAGQRIVDLQRRLLAANRTLEDLAKRDDLTGFYNRLALHRDLKARFLQRSGQAAAVSFIMADIDHFKRVNDTFGHDAGDAVLREFSRRVRGVLRQGDSVCRVGGEEFLMIAGGTDVATAKVVAERVRAAIEDEPFGLPRGQSTRITCSLGICPSDLGGNEQSFEENIKRADMALYQAKEQGRNQVVVFRDETSG